MPYSWICVADILAEAAASRRIVQYNNLVSRIEELGLDKLLSDKPLLNVRHPPLARGTLMADYL